MKSKKVLEVLNDQVNKELYSAYLYYAMAAYAVSEGLMGFAHWFNVQAKEEFGHADKLVTYINDRGGKVVLDAISQPDAKFGTPIDMFEKTLDHERNVTKSICNIVDVARKEGDHLTENFIQWYVNEQVEEEANVMGILQQMKIGSQPGGGGLLVLDHHLGKRGAE